MFGFKNPFSGGPTLAAACGSDQGKRRKNNEDNLYFRGFRMPEGTEGPGRLYAKRQSRVRGRRRKRVYAFAGQLFLCL